jgi:hypothetical protein
MADNIATKAPGLAATKHRVKSAGCSIYDLAFHPHLGKPQGAGLNLSWRDQTALMIAVRRSRVGGPDQRPLLFSLLVAARRLLAAVTDGLDLVPVRVADISAIITEMVLRSRSGSPLIGATMSQRRCMEAIDGGPVRSQEGDMGTIANTGRLTIERRKDPNLRAVRGTIASMALPLGKAAMTEGREHRVIETPRPVHVVGSNRHVTEHRIHPLARIKQCPAFWRSLHGLSAKICHCIKRSSSIAKLVAFLGKINAAPILTTEKTSLILSL